MEGGKGRGRALISLDSTNLERRKWAVGPSGRCTTSSPLTCASPHTRQEPGGSRTDRTGGAGRASKHAVPPPQPPPEGPSPHGTHPALKEARSGPVCCGSFIRGGPASPAPFCDRGQENKQQGPGPRPPRGASGSGGR